MRILVLPTLWTVLLDIVIWLIVHLAVSWWVTHRPAARFSADQAWYKPRKWEIDGRIYRWFQIRLWKSWLLDGAPWFDGVAKAELRSKDLAALSLFVIETCRGELAHWLPFGCGPFFFLWNKPWVGGLMLVYACLANVPCILVQRYNRARLWRILKKSNAA
jgi:glycosyl-4,4'-diaponeurosporenoate acyltransferase